MKKVYYLSTCSTCKRIMDDLNLSDFEKQDIKTNAITANQLDDMKEMSGTYESLFSRKAMKFRSMGLNEITLEEKDYRKYILEEYTFLKRPVFIVDGQIFVGNSKKVVEELAALLN
ncbi:arsenate reductase family protein [Roseivirga sp.]|uniref:arsenate reductase family protein n=1 Tax=Roseivirga sp. TaxID=1964215 RepID=UPI002B273546|nr:ArsC/Spx/MgsR family protein [Roseivirga sp.]